LFTKINGSTDYDIELPDAVIHTNESVNIILLIFPFLFVKHIQLQCRAINYIF